MGAVVTFLVLAALPAGASDDRGPVVVPPGATGPGMSYSKLAAKWWQYALSVPTHDPANPTQFLNPLFDQTGSNCGVAQSGPVFFLVGTFFTSAGATPGTAYRTKCRMPEGKALFFPVVNTECSITEGPGAGCPNTISGLRAAVKAATDGATNLEADIDGRRVRGLEDVKNTIYREQSVVFDFTLPADDILSFLGEGPFAPGTYGPAVDDGVYLLLPPLSRGSHVVHFHGEFPGGFVLDVTYDPLIVGKASCPRPDKGATRCDS